MKRLIVIFLCIAFAMTLRSQASFEKIYRTAATNDHLTSGLKLQDGTSVLAGYLEPNNHGYLIRIDANGDTIWTRVYKDNMIQSEAESPDSAIVIEGHNKTTNHFTIAKIDRAGQQKWFREMDDTIVVASSQLKPTADKGFLLIGGQRPAASTFYRACVRKIDSLGNLQWATVLNSSVVTTANTALELNNGDVLVAGTIPEGNNWRMLLYKLNSQGSLLWVKKYALNVQLVYPVLLDGGNNDVYLTAHSMYSSVLIKADTSGNILSARGYGDQSYPVFFIRGIKSGTGFVFCGVYGNSTTAGFVTKTNLIGDTLFTRQFRPKLNGTDFESIYERTGGGYILTGSTEGFSGVNHDYYAVATDSLGRTSCTGIFAPIPLSSVSIAVSSYSVPVLSSVGFATIAVQYTTNPMSPLAECVSCTVPAVPQDVTPSTGKTGCAPKAFTLSASGTGTLQWYGSATSTLMLGGGTTYVTPTLAPGQYTYFVEANTCTNSARSAITVTVANCTSIREEAGDGVIIVFPNPSENGCAIDFPDAVPLRVQVTDFQGRVLLTFEGSRHLNIQNGELQSGLYFIKADYPNHSQTIKFVVLR